MAYAFIENFKGGLDRSGSQLTGPPGTLWTLTNAHLNRRGEIERRKKFVSKYSTTLAGTYGCHALNDALYVFGSIADPGVPVGVTYQRLQHPDGSTAMSSLLASENFDGKIYAIAQFADGNKYHFYDGTIISDWVDGVVRSDFTDNDGIASHLQGLIDADDDYSASVLANVITITGPVGTAFTVTTKAETVSGGTDDQTAVVANTVTAVAGVDEVIATCSFRIVGGSSSAGTNKISSVAVNGVTVTSAAVDWATSNEVTAANIASNITANTSSPNYTAEASGDTVIVSTAAGVGDGANTYTLAVTAAGNVIVDNASFAITGGTASAGTNKVTSVRVNGIEILSTSVDWTTSNTATATAVAAQINSYNSSPEYIAFADGATVYVGKTVSTSTDATLTVAYTVGGDVTIGSVVDWSPTATSVSGGVDAVVGQAQQSTVTIGGTFEVGDRFSVIITVGASVLKFGADGNPEKQGEKLLTFKTKMYSTVSSLMFFSSVSAATLWNRDDTSNPGASFINMSAQDEGSQELTGLAKYQGNLAVFARNAIQIWSIDADPDLNVYLQTLSNTGTRSGDSVLSFGDNDVFYLADSGIRSIKARDSSNAAYVNDVGVKVDTVVTDYVATLTDAQVQAAVSVLEPVTDRFWLAVGSRIFVFSYFPGAQISAWSYYDTTDDIGGDISHFARTTDRLYARSGDVIYLYGGDANTTYPDDDEAVVTVEFPFLSADKPATFKNFIGFDVGCVNVWTVEFLTDPTNTATKFTAGTVSGTTYQLDDAAFAHDAPLVAPKLTCSTAGIASVSNFALHWEGEAEAG